MNMEEINVNSMDYRKLSNEDKLKVVKFKINKIINTINSTNSNNTCVYYKGKKVIIAKDNIGVFKDLCEREKKLEKYVTISEEQEVEKPIIDAEVVHATNNNGTNKKVTRKKVEELNLEEANNQIGFVKNYMDRIALLYKTVEYKDADIIEIQGYTGNSVFVPFSEQGHYQALYKYLRLLENRKVELEVAEIDKHLASDSMENAYEYLSEDDNPYETGYMQFATNYMPKKSVTIERESTKPDTPVTNSEAKEQKTVSSTTETNTIVPNNECKDLVVVEKNAEKTTKNSFGKKILGFLAGTAIVGGICNFGKKLGSKIKNGTNKVYTATKKKFNDISEILIKNKTKTAICAGIIALTAFASSFLPKIGSKRVKPADVTKPSSVVEVTEPTIKDNDNIIIDNPVIEEPTAPTEEVTKYDEYDLGEKVNIADNSYIYTNSYDATDKINEYTPYYDNSYDREVIGVTYEFDGNLYTIYKDDANATDKINELVCRGAKQTAVLVVRNDLVNTGDYEGYYNIDSVTRVKAK